MWDISESTAATVAACIPSLRVLIQDGKELSTASFLSFVLTPITGSSKGQTQVRRLSSHDPTMPPGRQTFLWLDDVER